MQSRDSVINQKVDMSVAIVDTTNLISIFALFLSDVGQAFIAETGRFFLFPLASMCAVIRSILAWRQSKLDEGKNGTVPKAILETAAAVAITAAVIGSLVASTIFATIAPIIFVATLGVKTIFHFASAIYFMTKSIFADNPTDKQKYKKAAYANAVGTVALALATVAIGFVFIAAKPIIGVLGILAGVIGVAFSLYMLCTIPTPPVASAKKAPARPVEPPQSAVELSVNPGISPQLRQNLINQVSLNSDTPQSTELKANTETAATQSTSNSDLLAQNGIFSPGTKKVETIKAAAVNDNPEQASQKKAAI